MSWRSRGPVQDDGLGEQTQDVECGQPLVEPADDVVDHVPVEMGIGESLFGAGQVVHQDIAGPVLEDLLDHSRIPGPTDVVDHMGAGGQRGGGHHRFVGVDRDDHPGMGGPQVFHHGDDGGGLDLGGRLGDGGDGGLSTDVDHPGPLLHQSVGQRQPRGQIGIATGVGERVEGGVHHSHEHRTVHLHLEGPGRECGLHLVVLPGVPSCGRPVVGPLGARSLRGHPSPGPAVGSREESVCQTPPMARIVMVHGAGNDLGDPPPSRPGGSRRWPTAWPGTTPPWTTTTWLSPSTATCSVPTPRTGTNPRST